MFKSRLRRVLATERRTTMDSRHLDQEASAQRRPDQPESEPKSDAPRLVSAHRATEHRRFRAPGWDSRWLMWLLATPGLPAARTGTFRAAPAMHPAALPTHCATVTSREQYPR